MILKCLLIVLAQSWVPSWRRYPSASDREAALVPASLVRDSRTAMMLSRDCFSYATSRQLICI